MSALCLALGVALLWPSVLAPIAEESAFVPSAAATPVRRPAQSQTSIQTSIACVDSQASSFAVAARSLAERAEVVTHGHLKLRCLAGGMVDGQRYDELGLIHEVQSGRLAMAVVTSSPLSNLDPDLEIFDVPFLFENELQADRVLLGPVGRILLDGLEKNGIKGLGTFELGFRVFSSSVPMPTLGDFRNKKIRVMQSSTAIAMVQLLGCEAVPSPVDKINQMAKEGYIDAADRTYPTYWDFKLYEVERYITETRHSYPIKVLIANQSWFASLNKDDQNAIVRSVPLIEREQRQRERAEDLSVKKKCLQIGIKIFELSPAQRREFSQACQPLYGEYEKLRGRYVLQEIRMAEGDHSGKVDREN
jgi:TRAP-type C4-dicarboxylate transport system substrate-binding protein